MFKLTAFVLLILLFSFPVAVEAASCGSGVAANNATIKMLQRQLSALRSIERGRGCTDGNSGGGLFNACRDVALKIGEVQSQLNASSVFDRDCRNDRHGAGSRSQRSKPMTVSAPVQTNANKADTTPQKVRGPKNALQFCVRLSDGYYFPTPNSQFKQKGGTDAALVQCRLICGTQNMAVYVLNDQNDETADMISVVSGQSYADLPTAYNYHGEDQFKRCNWNGYVAKIGGLLAAEKQVRNLVNTEIPAPVAKPHEDSTSVSQIAPSAYLPMPSRTVRMVGPAFIPDSQNKTFGLIGKQAN